MKIKYIAFVVGAVLMSGCQTLNGDINQKQKEITKFVDEEVDLAIDIRDNVQRRYRHIRHNKSIFVPPIENEDLIKPNWWFDEFDIGRGRKIPLLDAINMVMSDRSVNIKYEDGIDKSLLVSFHGATVGNALESISHASGYSFAIQSDNVLTWSKFQTKSFKIAAIPSTFKFALGKQKGATSSTNENVSSGDEFAAANSELDPLNELVAELKTYSSFRNVISKANTNEKGIASSESEIPIFLNRSASTITIRDVPHVVEQMAQIIKERNQLYRTQVEMDVEIIQVKLDNKAIDSFDVQLAIKELTSKGISLAAGGVGEAGDPFTSRFSGTEATFGIGGKINRGRATNTGALIELLNEKGSVTTRTMPRVIAHHNSIAKLRDLDRIKYIEERSTTSTSNVGVEQSISQADLDVGFSMYVVPTVYESDVSIAMATNLSNLIELVRNGDSGIPDENGTATYVESPYTTDKDFFNRFTVRSGDTVFFAGLSRSNKQIRKANAGIDAFGYNDYAENERVETIIAVTPRIIRPSAI
ncbi:hypothetical protein HB762_26770 (plasmid) [Vibrio campbellii]|uniref:Type II/III secretion system secretin-like domain-containing protein n=1 Tax=Vibrio campbellii TaxID=680 RepID=A0ABY5IKS2_9VIBR|nr:hypothetical protein [Vibrio campbellii]UTZ34867.1 hypothetical protein HB762_26770 [Vibrio campbellii]